MLRLLTNKAGKLPTRLLIISIVFLNYGAFSQKTPKRVDSVLLKKELDAVLAKYGLKTKGFAINVISLNQRGGQTAYSITNNFSGPITIVQQPELNEAYKKLFIRSIEQLKKDSGITSNKVFITVGNGSNAGKLVSQLVEYLKSMGYETNVGSSLSSFEGMSIFPWQDFDNVTKVVGLSIGNIGN